MEIVANKEKPGLPRNLLTNSDGPNINENSVCRDFVCSPCFGALMAIKNVFPDCEPALCEISHQFFRKKFGSCKIADFHSHFLVLGGSLIIKKKPLTPQAPRSGAKIWSKIMKNRIVRCSGRLAGAFAHRQRVVALHGPPIMSGGTDWHDTQL